MGAGTHRPEVLPLGLGTCRICGLHLLFLLVYPAAYGT